jgi:hypothetical protein
MLCAGFLLLLLFEQQHSELDTRNNRDFGSALTGFVFDGSSVGI